MCNCNILNATSVIVEDNQARITVDAVSTDYIKQCGRCGFPFTVLIDVAVPYEAQCVALVLCFSDKNVELRTMNRAGGAFKLRRFTCGTALNLISFTNLDRIGVVDIKGGCCGC